MSGPSFLQSLLRRLRTKLSGMIPILIAALALTLLLTLVIYAVSPFLPEGFRQLMQELRGGDWDADREKLSQMFEGYGAAKPYAYVALQLMQVIFAPIPGQLVGFVGGYFFGFAQALLLSMIGLALGSFIAIGLGRLLGERVVRRLVPAPILSKFDYLIKEGGLWNFFMLFLLPALPDDAICFIAGLTRLRVSHLVLACVLGRLPGTAVLVFVGSSVGRDMTAANVIFALGIITAAALWLYSDEVEEYFYRLIRRRSA